MWQVEASEFHAGRDDLREDQPVAIDLRLQQLPGPEGPSRVPRPSPSSRWSFSMTLVTRVRVSALSAPSISSGGGFLRN